MKIFRIYLVTVYVFAIITIPSGCYYDKEELLYPVSSCDTTDVRYSTSVAPIISVNCSGCHAGSLPSGGLNLDSHASLKTQVLNGKLIGSITHSSGFSPMPKNASKLNACNILRIQKWISDGSLNN